MSSVTNTLNSLGGFRFLSPRRRLKLAFSHITSTRLSQPGLATAPGPAQRCTHSLQGCRHSLHGCRHSLHAGQGAGCTHSLHAGRSGRGCRARPGCSLLSDADDERCAAPPRCSRSSVFLSQALEICDL